MDVAGFFPLCDDFLTGSVPFPLTIAGKVGQFTGVQRLENPDLGERLIADCVRIGVVHFSLLRSAVEQPMGVPPTLDRLRLV
jgi:hypothetical protein